MPLVPHAFLFRLAYPCLYVKQMPRDKGDLLALPPECRLPSFSECEGAKVFGEVRLAWNELGIGVSVRVRGKQLAAQGDVTRPRTSDGLTLWLDTRDGRASHRASRYCHQFHFLAAGGGEDRESAVFTQSKIHRALGDAPVCSPASIAFRFRNAPGGYELEAFLPASSLHGFDPEQNRRLGIFYALHDGELGEQLLALDGDFPYGEDPSLWCVLDLVGKPK